MAPFRSALAAAALLLAPLLASAPAAAQDFPSKPVTIVVPFTAGSPLDEQARSLGRTFEAAWNRPVIVENRPGAGSMIGIGAVAKAAPDGHTLLVTGSSITVMKSLIKDLPFDPLKDIAPVSLLGEFWAFYFVNRDMPAKTIEEFVAFAKANPGKLNYGGAGRNTTTLSVEAFKRITGAPLTEIAYAGQTQSIPALIRNEVQLVPASLGGGVKGQAEAGAIRPLMVLGSRRSPLYPDVPSAAEKGWNLPALGWVGVFAPGGTPGPVLEKVAAAVARHVANPEAQQRALAGGASLASSTPAEFKQRVGNEAKVWADVATAVGMKPE